MAREFHLNVLTPERQFFSGPVEQVIVETPAGRMGVLAGHVAMVAAVSIGEVHIKPAGEDWKRAFSSDGFMEIRPDGVVLVSQTMEWPEEIDERRAREAYERAQERLRQKQSIQEYHATMSSLARAMARLRVKSSVNLDR